MPAVEDKALFGVLSYANTNNIGDEIQSIAARRFLPSVDEFIEREAMSRFCPADAVRRNVIMNAWYAHSPENWPPSEFINPLFVAVHISEEPGWYSGLKAKDILLAEPVARYLRGYAPIGARDLNTLKLLNAAGIDAYFSGCLTLTIERPEVAREANLIVLNDIPEELSRKLQGRLTKNVVTTRHGDQPARGAAARFAAAEELLNLYARASCVVTTRLHCSLPCIAMGTPVLMVNNWVSDPYRFSGLMEFVHNASYNALMTGSCPYDIENPPRNPDRHLSIRASLIERVETFVKGAQTRSAMRPYPLTSSDQLEISNFIRGRLSAALIDSTQKIRTLEAQVRGLSVKSA
jgi:hypothetical protein